MPSARRRSTMSGTIDAAEVAKFDRMAAAWWDPHGEAAPLHAMNPCRLDYLCAMIAAQFGRDLKAPAPFEGLAILDVGCGGGLVAEPMARLGAAVTGVDAAGEGIAVARAHAAAQGLTIDYRETTAETLVAEGAAFDVVLALEIVEHVADLDAFLAALSGLARPGGLAILSTLNRTPQSFMAAVVGAEWLLRWLPRGTHDWRKFVTPDELSESLTRAGLAPVDRMGMVYAPLSGRWRLDGAALSANYLMTAVKG
ncbi:MAG: bifunctional 2-polyprenyl-6-hydroxyphenol methylase/3-demethylubiquinol 3-O-methyltransferase UbiG [Rhodobacteraceae bacterium]|nr:MAG: bifunctional 2-polyprenyl-6-hydroxyphenol methylase/3-demethylubiquinol 3-O-methyltransferase UbiG [Paracoccaceae bacterium]